MAQVNFYILSGWCWFSCGTLINSNNVWVWVSFKSVRYLQDYGSFHFCSRFVTVFLPMTRSFGAHELCCHFAMRQNPILFAVSPVSQNLYSQSLNDSHIFLARKYMLHSDTPLIVGIITEGCRIWDKKEEIWPSPMTKAPTPTEMSKRQSDNTNNATKKFEKRKKNGKKNNQKCSRFSPRDNTNFHRMF